MAELVLYPLPECDSCQKPESADELYTCIPGIVLCYDCHKKFIYDTSSKIIINRFDNLKYNKDTKTSSFPLLLLRVEKNSHSSST